MARAAGSAAGELGQLGGGPALPPGARSSLRPTVRSWWRRSPPPRPPAARCGVAGSGHSFTEAALTDGTMVRVEALSGVLDADPQSGLVKVGGGTVLADLNEELARLGLAMENLGDIDRQTIAGAISTGTHGTGARLRNISAQVEGAGAGSRRRQRPPARRRDPSGAAAGGAGRGRGAGGDLGGDPALRPRLHPRAGRRAAPARGGARRASRSGRTRNEHFELFTFPYSDLRWCSSATAPPRRRGPAAAPPPTSTTSCSRTGRWGCWRGPAGRCRGRSRRSRGLPAASPRAAGPATAPTASSPTSAGFASPRWSTGCRGSTARRRRGGWSSGCARNRYPVFFPIEMRVAAGDDAYLSPSHERDTAYIAVHQYRGMEWRPYFEAVEAIMDSYGGRPHWGKRHFQTAATLAAALPGLGRVPARPRRARPRPHLRQRVHRARPRPLEPSSVPFSFLCDEKEQTRVRRARGRPCRRRGRWGPRRRCSSPSTRRRVSKRSHSSPALAWRR